MKIAIAQLNYTVGAVQSNKIKIINSIYKAKEQGADLVIFAEYAISGSHCYDLLYKSSFMESCEIALIEIAYHCEDIAVLIGLPIQDASGNPISAGAFIENRRIKHYIGKNNIVLRDEFGFIYPSTGDEIVNLKGSKIAVVINENFWHFSHFGKNCDIIISLCADRYQKGIVQGRYDYLFKTIYKIGKPYIGVNQVGGQVDIVYDGHSWAFNEKGEIIAMLKGFEEDFQVVDINNAPPTKMPEQNYIENIYKAIKLGLSDYFAKNGFTKACLGLSGGIDSAVVLAMAVEALGAGNIRALILPSEFSTEHSVDDAIEMAENLGVEYDVIPISETYNTILESMKPVIGGTPFDVTEENIQSRIRCTMLMAMSNKLGYILLNTSNKSEAAMGYGTLYGDVSGAISILGDLYKIDVYSLARFINRYVDIIPRNIISKAPSAELRPDQKDSDSLPPYDILDAILYRFIEEKQSVEDIINAGFDSELVRFIVESIKYNEYKRRQSCPVLRLSTCSFGSDIKLPLINKYVL